MKYSIQTAIKVLEGELETISIWVEDLPSMSKSEKENWDQDKYDIEVAIEKLKAVEE